MKTTFPTYYIHTRTTTGYEFGSRGSCEGDSGGPLIRYVQDSRDLYYEQIGIVQGGVGKCGSRDFPSIYVRLENEEVLNFIKEATGEDGNMECGGDDEQAPRLLRSSTLGCAGLVSLVKLLGMFSHLWRRNQRENENLHPAKKRDWRSV